mgnify:CR=1 FL=1
MSTKQLYDNVSPLSKEKHGSWSVEVGGDFAHVKGMNVLPVLAAEFVTAYTKGERPPFANVGSQAKFVEPRPNGISVRHLFRYENQAGLLAFLEERLGTTIDLPRENVSPRRDLSLSPEIAAKLRRKCAADFETWEGAT